MAPQPQTIDEALDPQRASDNATMNFLGGFIRGGLIGAAIVGIGAIAVFAGMAAFAPAAAGAAAAAAPALSTSATWLSILGSAAIPAAIGGLTLGAASGAARAAGMVGVANGFQLGRQTASNDLNQALMEQEALLNQMMAEAKGAKKAMDFSNMPNHPANAPKADKTAQGQFTAAALAGEDQQTQAAR